MKEIDHLRIVFCILFLPEGAVFIDSIHIFF